MRRIILVVALTAFALAGCRQNESEPAATARSDSAEATAAPVQPAEKISPELIDRIIGPFNKGVALMDQYRPVEAVEAFEEVARVASDWIPGRLNLGIALLNSQSDEGYARAEEELKWVINKVPDDPYAHYALGMLLRHLTRFDEAQTQFEAVLTIDPEDADAHYQLGILIMDRDPVAARQHLEKTLQKIPHHESACYRLATLLRKTGEKAKARDMLLRFQALKTSGAGVFSGMKYGEMGRYAAVLRAFGEQVSGPPQAAPEFNETGAATASFTPARGAAGWPGEDRPQTAAAYGPGIAAANVFGNGTMAIYITGAGPDGDGTLYQAAGGSLTAVPNTGIDGRDAVGAWFGTSILLGLLDSLSTLIMVLVGSMLVAFALDPAVSRLERAGMRRGAATFLLMAGTVVTPSAPGSATTTATVTPISISPASARTGSTAMKVAAVSST